MQEILYEIRQESLLSDDGGLRVLFQLSNDAEQ